MNWPDFAALPARLGWPARNRHTVACMHRLSHILGWPREPAVWFMSEWRAVANEHARRQTELPISSGCFEIATGVKGLNKSWTVYNEEKLSVTPGDVLSSTVQSNVSGSNPGLTRIYSDLRQAAIMHNYMSWPKKSICSGPSIALGS